MATPAPHPFQNGGSQQLLTFLGPHPFLMSDLGSVGILVLEV